MAAFSCNICGQGFEGNGCNCDSLPDRDICPGCKEPLDVCPHGGDCLEVQSIYREQQREKMKDLDFTDEELEEYAARARWEMD